MRYIPTKHLKPGYTLASDLMFSKKRIMLRSGKSLTKELINRIDLLGFQGVYIDDAISEGLYIKDVISPDLRMKTKDELSSLLDSAKHNRTSKINSQMVTIKQQIENIVNEILQNCHVMVNIIDIRTHDDYTYSHSLNVAILATIIGTVQGLKKQQLYELAMGALLHDTGKIFIDKTILNKPGKLTDKEFTEMKKHCELGYNFLTNNVNISETTKISALQHHETYDGNGYPNGLFGSDIHLFGRIICVVDVYDALISDRPYRKAMLPSDAIEYIMSGYNTKFDPNVVDSLIKKVAAYPVGTCVRLNTGDKAIVVKNNETASLRPVVKLITDKKEPDIFIDLANDRAALKITISEILDC